MARFAARAESAGRRVDVDVPAGSEIDADRLRLEQALGNLLDNALRHGDGTVTLQRAAATTGPSSSTSTDEGPGFPTSSPSVRSSGSAAPTRRAEAEGSGLGLAIVDAVAHAHGGTAGLTRQEHGADVWLRLPAHIAG